MAINKMWKVVWWCQGLMHDFPCLLPQARGSLPSMMEVSFLKGVMYSWVSCIQHGSGSKSLKLQNYLFLFHWCSLKSCTLRLFIHATGTCLCFSKQKRQIFSFPASLAAMNNWMATEGKCKGYSCVLTSSHLPKKDPKQHLPFPLYFCMHCTERHKPRN